MRKEQLYCVACNRLHQSLIAELDWLLNNINHHFSVVLQGLLNLASLTHRISQKAFSSVLAP